MTHNMEGGAGSKSGNGSISLNDVGILSTMGSPFPFRAVKELAAVLQASGHQHSL